MKIISVSDVYISPQGNVVIKVVYEDENGNSRTSYRVMDSNGDFITGYMDDLDEAKSIADGYKPSPGGRGPKV